MEEMDEETQGESDNESRELPADEGGESKRESAGERKRALREGVDGEKRRRGKKKRKTQDAAERTGGKRGVCYLSRIPPHLKPLKLRHLLAPFGEVLRIYLAPEDAAVRMRRKRAGGNSGKNFTEGWVEFAHKSDAKQIAAMLNGEPMEAKKRSAYHYDLWNVKYLHRFKWDNLTEEIAYKSAVREQRLAAEISAARKERDFYLSRVDQSRAINSMAERKRKKMELEGNQPKTALTEGPITGETKVVRSFPQRRSMVDGAMETTPQLALDVLTRVFGTKGAQ